MKLVRFSTAENSSPRVAILENDKVIPVIQSWEDILRGGTMQREEPQDLNSVKLHSPIARPGKVIAIGLNYMDHCREVGIEPPKRPLVFTKFTTSIIGPNEAIQWSTDLTKEVDWEVELAVVIGKTASKVSPEDALKYVAGYTIANDVSARDLQFGDGQWVRGKSLDTFCPIGPIYVSADEIPDPQNLKIRCEVNGQIMQNSSTAEMIFDVKTLISFCSQSFTLEVGDVILTGTPHGVGTSRDPKIYLNDGDTVVCEIEGIGRLENTCKVV